MLRKQQKLCRKALMCALQPASCMRLPSQSTTWVWEQTLLSHLALKHKVLIPAVTLHHLRPLVGLGFHLQVYVLE